MPLPPLLVQRLTKRKILEPHANTEAINDQPPAHVNEEVIAEDYDNKPDDRSLKEQFWGGSEAVDIVKGYKGCPNKSNIYHDCTKFCIKLWKKGRLAPSDSYLELKNKVLEKWPLPAGWEEVYDEGYGQHYFWNVHNNLVTWYPPAHPNAIISKSAASLRKQRIDNASGDEESNEDSDQEVPELPQKEKKRDRHEKAIVHHRDKKRLRVKDNDLDPMDPAAYSDIPRGNWTTGLDRDAKTGVDSTVSGPLYQARPYPAPGAILAANAKHQSPPPSP